ncbi:MAG: metallophosphoesterase [Oscillospiraceae bacterium]|nr:metallophosphoesterase [Oscillospiraceae bacterium]
MRILVLSDSHAGLSFMRQCMRSVRPDCVIHLGDFYEDGKALSEENPGTPFYQVPGNCDRYRCPEGLHESMCLTFDGVWIFMTHGHRQKVKFGLGELLAQARVSGAQAVLYGHTHRADCRCEEGLWILNPGSCGSWGGSAGVIEIENQTITACKIITQEDLEDKL